MIYIRGEYLKRKVIMNVKLSDVHEIFLNCDFVIRWPLNWQGVWFFFMAMNF